VLADENKPLGFVESPGRVVLGDAEAQGLVALIDAGLDQTEEKSSADACPPIRGDNCDGSGTFSDTKP
jgi:hypothetical protein